MGLIPVFRLCLFSKTIVPLKSRRENYSRGISLFRRSLYRATGNRASRASLVISPFAPRDFALTRCNRAHLTKRHYVSKNKKKKKKKKYTNQERDGKNCSLDLAGRRQFLEREEGLPDCSSFHGLNINAKFSRLAGRTERKTEPKRDARDLHSFVRFCRRSTDPDTHLSPHFRE